MIRVEGLTKRYAGVAAVDGVSFAIGRGEVVGLLGPNGAGKTTTMRMLTTFLAPSSGRAAMAGHDVLEQPLEVRRRVGYLPENVPLYPEMRVRSYLLHRAKLKDVPGHRRASAVDSALERCRIDDVQDRIVGQLSRGYRQRVGLADALVHDPEILILDEPTSGLDPIQVREVRGLIRDLGRSHTVLLSTHILPEVEATCTRAIIIARGRIALDEPIGASASAESLMVEARGPVDSIREALRATPGVEAVEPAGQDGEAATFRVRPHPGRDPREEIARRLVVGGWPLRRLERRGSSLEERFVLAVGGAGLDPAGAEVA